LDPFFDVHLHPHFHADRCVYIDFNPNQVEYPHDDFDFDVYTFFYLHSYGYFHKDFDGNGQFDRHSYFNRNSDTERDVDLDEYGCSSDIEPEFYFHRDFDPHLYRDVIRHSNPFKHLYHDLDGNGQFDRHTHFNRKSDAERDADSHKHCCVPDVHHNLYVHQDVYADLYYDANHDLFIDIDRHSYQYIHFDALLCAANVDPDSLVDTYLYLFIDPHGHLLQYPNVDFDTDHRVANRDGFDDTDSNVNAYVQRDCLPHVDGNTHTE
jgi:hypothetical protein